VGYTGIEQSSGGAGVDLWSGLAELLSRLVDQADETTIALIIFVEEAGLPLPVPGDLLMVLAGYRVARGTMGLLWLLCLLEAATVLGASLLYWLGARGGRPLLYRYGRYFHLDRPRLDRIEAWLRQRGARAVVLGRLVFGLRVATALVAGAFGVPYRTFLPSVALGGGGYIALCVLLGMWLGPRAVALIEGLQLSIRAGLTVLLSALLGAAFATLHLRGAARAVAAEDNPAASDRFETAALAGLLATLGMGLGVNVALYLLAAVGVLLPEQLMLAVVEQAARRYAGDHLALLVALLFLGAVVWAVLYAGAGRARLPGPPWLRGLLFSAVPLAVSGLVVLPLLGAGPFGFGLGAGPLPLAGELLRHALFGAGLGVSYELLRSARAAEAAPARAPAYAG
jgi:membrane protein DedA with SNARE-associated domain